MSKGEYTNMGVNVGPVYVERDNEGNWNFGVSVGPKGGIGAGCEAEAYAEVSFGKDGVSAGVGANAGVCGGFETGAFGAYVSKGAYIDSRK